MNAGVATTVPLSSPHGVLEIMKSYFWKFVICVLPCVLAGWVAIDAFINYQRGEPGFFNLKKGVDLDGGTILVYEIDVRKTASQKGESSSAEATSARTDMTETTKILAESLKR